MKSSGILAALAVSAAALVLFLVPTAESRGSDSADRRIACVDVARILKESPRARETEEWYGAAVAELRSSLRDRAREHARKRSDLVLVEGTEKYEAQQVALDEEAWRIDYDGERGLKRIEAARARRIRGLLTTMRDEARNLAMRRGYDLVLSKNDGMFDLVKIETADQVLSMAAANAVLYGADHLDITDEVLEALAPPENPK